MMVIGPDCSIKTRKPSHEMEKPSKQRHESLRVRESAIETWTMQTDNNHNNTPNTRITKPKHEKRNTIHFPRLRYSTSENYYNVVTT